MAKDLSRVQKTLKHGKKVLQESEIKLEALDASIQEARRIKKSLDILRLDH